MIGTSALRSRRRGFDPRLGLRTVVSSRSAVGTALRTAALCATLATTLTLAAASPAYAAGQILATKSIAAPLGFRGVCARYAWACDASQASRISGTQSLLSTADRVNRAVNSSVREISDDSQYRTREYWALPTARGGDCEDFALLKKRELMKAGVGADRLLIATVLDRRQNAHAVLVLRTDAGDYVLDNLTSRIKPWDKTGYSFLRMQDPRTKTGWRLVMKGGIFG